VATWPGAYRFAVRGAPGRWSCATASTLACEATTGAQDRASPKCIGLASESSLGSEMYFLWFPIERSPIERNFGARFLSSLALFRPQVPTLVCDAKCPVVDGAASHGRYSYLDAASHIPVAIIDTQYNGAPATKCQRRPWPGAAIVQCGPGERIVAVEHASFAAPLAPWVHPACEPHGIKQATAQAPLRCAAGSAQYVVERACLGKERCEVKAREDIFDPGNQTKCRLMSGSRQLIIHAVCAK
jgi:hypothetical protein